MHLQLWAKITQFLHTVFLSLDVHLPQTFCVPNGIPLGCGAFVGATYQSCGAQYTTAQALKIAAAVVDGNYTGPLRAQSTTFRPIIAVMLNDTNNTTMDMSTKPACTASLECVCQVGVVGHYRQHVVTYVDSSAHSQHSSYMHKALCKLTRCHTSSPNMFLRSRYVQRGCGNDSFSHHSKCNNHLLAYMDWVQAWPHGLNDMPRFLKTCQQLFKAILPLFALCSSPPSLMLTWCVVDAGR